MKIKFLGLLKNKTFVAWFVLLIIVIGIVLITNIKHKSIDNFLQPKSVENDPGTNIIQSMLVDTGELTFAEIPKLYEGTLIFQDYSDGERHSYFVCLENMNDVKLHAIYDLPANYYVPHGGPNESMETNGCNFSLHLSNLEVDISKEIQTEDSNLRYKEPEGTFSFEHPITWKVSILPEQIFDISHVTFPKTTKITLSTNDTNLHGEVMIQSYDIKKFADSKLAWDEMWNEPLGNDIVDFGSKKVTRSKISAKVGGIDAQITTYGYDNFSTTGTVLTQEVSIYAKNQSRIFEIDAIYTADQKITVDKIIKSIILN